MAELRESVRLIEEDEVAETPWQRLRRIHGEMFDEQTPWPTLTLIQGGRDAE